MGRKKKSKKHKKKNLSELDSLKLQFGRSICKIEKKLINYLKKEKYEKDDIEFIQTEFQGYLVYLLDLFNDIETIRVKQALSDSEGNNSITNGRFLPDKEWDKYTGGKTLEYNRNLEDKRKLGECIEIILEGG